MAAARPGFRHGVARIRSSSVAAAAAATSSHPIIRTRHECDVIIVGGGHNGMVSAAYLARAGLDVMVLERRGILGGAAVTEEVVKGFRFSRASYLAGLLRPSVIQDLSLHKHGLKYLVRDPSSFTPSLVDGPLGGRSLLLGSDMDATCASIAQFSEKDSKVYPLYEEFLAECREILRPLLDGPPPDPFQGRYYERKQAATTLYSLIKNAARHRGTLGALYELLTAPACHVLDKWFESDMLKATLACDAVIGAMISPRDVGSGYVLLHHVLGEAAGKQGVWAYVEGGMGRISDAIASAAKEAGAKLLTNCQVKSIDLDERAGSATGVTLESGESLTARVAVLSNCTAHQTITKLLPENFLDSFAGGGFRSYVRHIKGFDYSCGSFKINCALSKLPDFACLPNGRSRDGEGSGGANHRGTIHFENTIDEIETAAREASNRVPATRPVIEMTIPSVLDHTLVDGAGHHVAQLFVQFAPYDIDPTVGNWKDPAFKQAFVDRVFGVVDEFAPGFSDSIVGIDALSPLDLEEIFGSWMSMQMQQSPIPPPNTHVHSMQHTPKYLQQVLKKRGTRRGDVLKLHPSLLQQSSPG